MADETSGAGTTPSRRCFLKSGAWAGAALLSEWPFEHLSATLLAEALAGPSAAMPVRAAAEGARVVRTGCPSHNCGGRCLLTRLRSRRRHHPHRDATTVRATRVADPAAPGLRPRPGLPAPPVSPRPPAVSHEARRPERARADSSASRGTRRSTASPRRSQRVKDAYGNTALFVPYGTGSYSQINGRQTAQRLMNLRRRLARASTTATPGRASRRRRRPSTARRHRQPAPGLAQREVHPDVGLEPGRDARRDEQRVLRPAGPGARRPHRLHRPAHDAERGRPGRRVGPHPARERTRP